VTVAAHIRQELGAMLQSQGKTRTINNETVVSPFGDLSAEQNGIVIIRS